MDLTKVVLPTFILERRSLLEMYADFFAHPDLFVRYGLFMSNIIILAMKLHGKFKFNLLNDNKKNTNWGQND